MHSTITTACLLIAVSAVHGQSISFVDVAANDYRLSHLRGVSIGVDVFDFRFWNGAAFDDLTGTGLAWMTTRRPIVDAINSLAIAVPDGAALTHSLRWPAGGEETPDGEGAIHARNIDVDEHATVLTYDMSTDDMLYGLRPSAAMPIDVAWISLTPTLPGDATLDGMFGSDDLVHVLAAGVYETGLPASWQDGDFTRDTLADSGDLVLALSTGSYEIPAAAHVPEPAGALMLAIAFTASITTRRTIAG